MENVDQTINVTGMTCGNCVRHVTDALLDIAGVESAEVDLASASAKIRANRTIPRDELARALDEAGYDLA